MEGLGMYLRLFQVSDMLNICSSETYVELYRDALLASSDWQE